MKKKLLVFLLSGLIFSACSNDTESDYLMPIDESVKKATNADSPLLISSPTELYFTDVNVLTEKTDTVNIKTAGLPTLGVLTRFDVTVQGINSDYFHASSPTLSLNQLLQALLGGGIDIPVTYRPYEDGPHEAELLITATLLGVLAPVQITVPLHGTTETVSVPTLLYSIPENEGIVNWDGRIHAEAIDKGQYHIDFVFDQNIYFSNSFIPSDIMIVQPTSAVVRNIEIINSNTLRVTITEDITFTTNELIITGGAITSFEGLNSDIGNETIRLTYTASSDIPDNYIE